MHENEAKITGRRFRLSVGVLLFILILVYLTYHLVAYLSRETVPLYTVGEETSLASNVSYHGLILRSEEIVRTPKSGYLQLYRGEGERVSVGDPLFGVENSAPETSSSEGDLSSRIYSAMSQTMASFNAAYSNLAFYKVYDLERNLAAQLRRADSASLTPEQTESSVRAESSGIVEFYFDQYELFDPQTVTAEDFDLSAYEKQLCGTGTPAQAGTSVCKLITDESWSILIQLSEEEAAQYKADKTTRVKVLFPDSNLSTTVLFEPFTGADGAQYAKLTLTKYMVRYAGARHLELTILNSRPSGLKIPNTALTEYTFYKIPAAYLAKGGNSTEDGFYRQVPESGSTIEFVEASIVRSDSDYVYVSRDSLQQGDVLIMPDSVEQFTVSMTQDLPGVYVANRGYTVFQTVEVLDSDTNYSIVKSGLSYSISPYDSVVTDAASVSGGQLLY